MIKNRVQKWHFLFLTLIAATLAFSSFVYGYSFHRLFEAVRDVGTSFYFYIVNTFTGDGSGATVLLPSSLDLEPILPLTWDDFCARAGATFFALFEIKNLLSYVVFVAKSLHLVTILFSLFLPILLLLFFLFKNSFETERKEEKVSKPLQLYYLMRFYFRKKALPVLRDIKSFVFRRKFYLYILVLLWIINLNIATIALELVSFYFYFIASFDFLSLYVLFYKLFIDLYLAYISAPLLLWLLVGFFIFDKIRRYIAVERLRHLEAKNKGFINSLPVCVMACASMGMGKTTAITDMLLSQECIFRHEALKGMFEEDFKFPNFPFLNLERAFQKAIDDHAVYNLATARQWIADCEKRFMEDVCSDNCFGYDVINEKLVFYNGIRFERLFSVLSKYVQYYFIYITEVTIVSNYSVRTDGELKSKGLFPLWDDDFFKKNKREGRYCHVLDFDVFRLGKKVLEHNKNFGSLEFGCIGISEIGKERGNKNDLEELRKREDEANQKNDLFDLDLRMRRHAATVGNTCFLRLFSDEQRSNALGANVRELCEIHTIVDKSERQLSMPFFLFGEIANCFLRPRFREDYYNWRYNRVDMTLTMFLYKSLAGAFLRYYDRIYRLYGFHAVTLQVERGDGIGEVEQHDYYLLHQKIYDKRFSTDCFADFYAENAKKTAVGINEYPCYRGIRAEIDELKLQNSYFINSVLENAFKKEKEKEEENANDTANRVVPPWVQLRKLDKRTKK